MKKIAIISKPMSTIATVNDYGVIWLQYSLKGLLHAEVKLFSWDTIIQVDLSSFGWVILDCSASHSDKMHIEEHLRSIVWKEGRTVVRINSRRPFEDEIRGIKVVSSHLLAHGYKKLMTESHA